MTKVGRWTFAGVGGPVEETERWRGLELRGGARLTRRGLQLDPGQWATAQPDDRWTATVGDRTLVAWVSMDSFGVQHLATVVSLAARAGSAFDSLAIVESQWHGRRSSDSTAPTKGPIEPIRGRMVQVAVSFRGLGSAGTEVTVFRNGVRQRQFTSTAALAPWTPDAGEVVFGLATDALPTPLVEGTVMSILAAELHDVALTEAQVAALSADDPSGFLRPAVTVRPQAVPAAKYDLTAYCLSAVAGDPLVRVVGIPAAGDEAEYLRCSWMLVPGLADPSLISFRHGRGYLVADADASTAAVTVATPDGTADFRERATFTRRPGLNGLPGGLSYESWARPGSFLRHVDKVVRLEAVTTDAAAQRDATFTEQLDASVDRTTELALDDNTWYLISSSADAPGRFLGLLDDGASVGFVTPPVAGPLDRVLWRLEAVPEDGIHRVRVVNRKAGGSRFLEAPTATVIPAKDYTKLLADRAKARATGTTVPNDPGYVTPYGKAYVRSVFRVSADSTAGAVQQRWTLEPIPWAGSDHYAMVNDPYDPARISYPECLVPRTEAPTPDFPSALSVQPLNLFESAQHWRFTAWKSVDPATLAPAPARIASLQYASISHADYVTLYPGYGAMLGMDVVATKSVSEWALASVRTVITNVVLDLRDRTLVPKLRGLRVIVVGDGDGDDAGSYPDISNGLWTLLRGGYNGLALTVTEEMMCRTGITHRPTDTLHRTYDQVIHEFGHALVDRLKIEAALQSAMGTDYHPEAFACYLQAWFDCMPEWHQQGTRSYLPPAARPIMATYFRPSAPWRPHEVPLVH